MGVLISNQIFRNHWIKWKSTWLEFEEQLIYLNIFKVLGAIALGFHKLAHLAGCYKSKQLLTQIIKPFYAVAVKLGLSFNHHSHNHFSLKDENVDGKSLNSFFEILDKNFF